MFYNFRRLSIFVCCMRQVIERYASAQLKDRFESLKIFTVSIQDLIRQVSYSGFDSGFVLIPLSFTGSVRRQSFIARLSCWVS